MTTATSHTPHHSGDAGTSLTRTAFSATVHCLTGCAIGEILGMVLSTWWGWSNTFDTLIILIVPGAIDAGLGEPLFWGSLAGALFVAFWAAFPVNRALIARGKGHAVIHAYHSATTPTRSRSRQSPQGAHTRSESRTHLTTTGGAVPRPPHRDRAVG